MTLDTFNGLAWVAVAPFDISILRVRRVPALPGLSSFAELNVRTYVRVNGRGGVFFFSLDAASRVAVFGARLFYRLPYMNARMSITRDDGDIRYQSVRTDRRGAPATFIATYRLSGAASVAPRDSLVSWLTERYRLYTVSRGRVIYADIHHLPWSLHNATADVETNTMASSHGIALPATPPLLHFAKELDVVIWPPRAM